MIDYFIRGGFFMWPILGFFIFGLAACNTIEGAGKDVDAAGDAVEDTARENKNY